MVKAPFGVGVGGLGEGGVRGVRVDVRAGDGAMLGVVDDALELGEDGGARGCGREQAEGQEDSEGLRTIRGERRHAGSRSRAGGRRICPQGSSARRGKVSSAIKLDDSSAFDGIKTCHPARRMVRADLVGRVLAEEDGRAAVEICRRREGARTVLRGGLRRCVQPR